MLNTDIQLRPSKINVSLIFLLSFGSLLMVYYSQCAIWVKCVTTMLVVIYSIRIYYNNAAWLGARIRRLSNNEWQIIKQDDFILVNLLGESTVTTWVCALRFQIPGKKKKFSCLIFRDAVEPMDNYRKLLVQLRCIRPEVSRSREIQW